VTKYKGLTNEDLQIRASVSDDGLYVIAGSDQQNVYIWYVIVKALQIDSASVCVCV